MYVLFKFFIHDYQIRPSYAYGVLLLNMCYYHRYGCGKWKSRSPVPNGVNKS